MAASKRDVGARRDVVFLIYDGVEILDVAGPISIFSAANGLLGAGAKYNLIVAAPRRGRIASSSGVLLHAERDLASVRGAIDTMIVPGRSALPFDRVAPELAAATRRIARRARRVASVCTGAFVLADAGLLAGRRATTHWASCSALKQRARACDVLSDPIFVQDGPVWTSAGVSAGMDLSLALVEQDHGRALALQVAKWLVMYLQRPGGQAQFSVPLAAQHAAKGPLRELETWLLANLGRDLSVDALAAQAKMSPRTFARAFVSEFGTTPARYVERARLEAARRWLEAGDDLVSQIATRCGFERAETFDRAFARAFQMTPREYRAHFRRSRVVDGAR